MDQKPTGNEKILDALNTDAFQKDFFKTMSYDEYLRLALERPSVAYSAHQRLYSAITFWGSKPYRWANRDLIHFNAFDDPVENGKDGVFGLDRELMRFVGVCRSAAARHGQERRIILFRGPVGSSKSTIARLVKKLAIYYSKTDEGKLFTHFWVPENDEDRRILGLAAGEKESICPLHEEPLLLLPEGTDQNPRADFVVKMNAVKVKALNDKKKEVERERLDEEMIELEGYPCPYCRRVFMEFLKKYDGDWKTVLEKHVRVCRLTFSEEDRVGIGTFRPKDEKNQDSTELSGDINYRKIAEIGKESDPRAFNFDGEFQVANRGVLFWEELLKLDKAFLYDLLGATQEHVIKPKRFSEHYVDVVHIAATNNPEYKALMEDEKMEAFKDRTTTVDVPYVLNAVREQEIYEKIFRKKRGLHMGPHVIEMTSWWSVLTRMKEPAGDKTKGIKITDKARLLAGKQVRGMNEENLHELLEEHRDEGQEGISPRYIQDKIGNAKSHAAQFDLKCVSWFLVKDFLAEGLKGHWDMNEKKEGQYRNLLEQAHKDYLDLLKGEVQEAIALEEDDIEKIFLKYINSVKAFVEKSKLKNERNEMVQPDERLMRSIETQIDIGDGDKEEYRQRLMMAFGTKAAAGEKFDYKSDDDLYRALRLKLFEDRKDQINLTTMLSGVSNKKEQEKIEVIKNRMITRFGYCERCASDALHEVASIFARGEEEGG